MYKNNFVEEEIDAYIRQKRYRQINSVLVYQNSQILAKRYYNGFDESSKNVINSVAKSIMSIATGIAVDKGWIQSIEEPIYSFLPQFGEGRDPLHRAITIRHLLSMTSGIFWNGGIHYHCPMMLQMRKSGDWISYIADCAVVDYPGTKYNYKEWDVILLAKVFDSVGIDLYALIDRYLFNPLGIVSTQWYQSPCGVYYSVGDGEENESRAMLTAIDMMKIGQVFLQGGIWDGQRIISESYIKEAVTPLKCNGGYGLLWWLGDDWHGCRGYGGQSITVIPDKNAVIVTQATPTSRGMGYFDVVDFCSSLLYH